MEAINNRHKMRILLRQGQEYLQPSGEWGDRQTAREFTDSVLAYYWAKDQQLLGIEVLLAFDDAQWDVIAMRT